MSHTPGPWKVVERSGGVFRVYGTQDVRGVKIAEVLGRGRISRWRERNPEANARLIAAAPDLLAALEPFAYLADILEEGQYLTFGGVYISDQQAKAAATALAASKGEAR